MPNVTRSYCASLQASRRRLHLDTAEVIRRAFPALPQGASRFGISRARNGDVSNPLYRLAAWFADARAAGFTSRAADECIGYLQSRRAELWAGERLSFDAEMTREQQLDGAEDCAQLRACRDVAGIPLYVERLDEYIAQAMRLRRAAVAHYEASR